MRRQDRRLGRLIRFDERSRAYALAPTIDKSTWRDHNIRIYDPIPNPNQVIGDCTGVADCILFNAQGNRVKGVVLDMQDADAFYSLATTLDPYDGQYPPTDTGSSTLAAAKAAQKLGYGGEYRWLFGGADEVVQALMPTPEFPYGQPVNVGTYWMADMFTPDSSNRVHVSGGEAGGHSWIVRGYWKSHDWLLGRCWWGEFRDFWISRTDLDALLHNDGDAHTQRRAA